MQQNCRGEIIMATVDAPPVTVLVVDDDPVTRAGLRTVLSGDPRFAVIGDALTDDATPVLRLRPNIVVTDPYTLRHTRATLIADLVVKVPMTSICIYTNQTESWAVFEALRAGAQAYILKSSCSAEFLS